MGRYEIVREIGRGGMATVYVARQVELDRRVALKELGTMGHSDPSFAQRFLREARLAGSFSHPNIVTVHDYFEHDQVPYIAMEYLARGSLRPYVGGLTVPQTGGVLEGLLAGLAHAERHEVVHRDIKPENLLVTQDGGIKIADFGIAKATHSLETNAMLTAAGSTLGTPNYIAPEQAMAGRLGPWTDLYSVGVTAFELLVGHTPFGDTKEPMNVLLRQIHELPPRVRDLVPDMDPSISDWVGWLVSKAPADRPQTAVEAWDRLEAALDGIFGPRWRREAAVSLPQDQPAPPRGPWYPPPAAATGRTLARSLDRDTSATPRGAIGPIPPWPEGGMPLAEAPESAATAAPRRQHPDARPASHPGRAHRISVALKLASAVAALALAVAIFNTSQQEPLAQLAEQPSPTQGPDTATETTSPAPQTTPLETGAAPLTTQAAPARRLAQTYAEAARRFAEGKQSGSARDADSALVGALRRTAKSYRAAADAAARNDLPAYTAALTAAEANQQMASTLLNRDLRGADSSRSPAPQSPSEPSTAVESTCAGDSTSDDPSDDECGE